MAKQITLKEYDDIFSLSYHVAHSGSEKPDFFIPKPRLLAVFDIIVNGHKLDASTFCVQRIQAALTQSALWKQLLYNVDVSEEQLGSISLVLKCGVFGDIFNDFKFAENVAVVEKVHFTYKYFTPCGTVYYSCFFNNLQYTLSSALFDMERQHPFVFSYYSRHLFEINYDTLIRVFTELNSPILGPEKADNAEMLQLVLTKLQYFSLNQYNTIAVMKECDTNAYRLRQCQKSITKPRRFDDLRLLRNFALLYRMLAEDACDVGPDQGSCV